MIFLIVWSLQNYKFYLCLLFLSTPFKNYRNSIEALAFENTLNELLAITIDREISPKTAIFQASMIKYRNYILPCLYNLDIPPDNNGSERAIRNVKIKQKVAGQFKTGQNAFCTIRSVIDTLLKRNLEVLPYLTQIIKLQPVS
ncbi:transposase [Runella sp.]|uniref:IS66 family transposase n=1 Tax=Runella sp. TaxID=1960881 RepID=UPI003018D095